MCECECDCVCVCVCERLGRLDGGEWITPGLGNSYPDAKIRD